jgi:malonate transporter
VSALTAGIAPVFAMILLGWGLRQTRFLPDEGWRAVERLTYFIFYPAFLTAAVWRADFSGGTAGPVALSTIGLASIVAFTTVASAATMPMLLSVFRFV